MNTREITRDAVMNLMMEDGFGPDEVMEHTADYSIALTGHDTPTGRLRVKQIANGILREVIKQKGE